MMKTERIAVRVPAELKKRVLEAEKKTGIDEATIVRSCLIAFLDYVEEHGEITVPIQITPHSKRERDKTKYPEREGEATVVEEKVSSSSSSSTPKRAPANLKREEQN